MEIKEILIIAIVLVWGILNIILFFKIWGACNNIKRIADKYDPDGRKFPFVPK